MAYISPYTTQADLEVAAGSKAKLLELTGETSLGSGVADPTVMGAAQAEADSFLDARVRRQYGAELPFGTTPSFATVPPLVKAIAAKEAVYVLRQYKNAVGDEDRLMRAERENQLARLDAGQDMLSPDTYPIETGGGAPISGIRGTSSSSASCPPPSRDDTRGFW